MGKISVIAEFEVNSADMDQFYEKLRGHASTSLAEDEGCERFDVMRPVKSADTAFIYEIWQSREALTTHAESEHTANYRVATEGMVKNRKLTICDLNESGNP